MTLKLVKTSVVKSRPPVPYGANLLCFILCMFHSSETWPVKKENELTLQQAQMRMND